MPAALGYDTETLLINGEIKEFPDGTILEEGSGWTFNTKLPKATDENKDCVLIYYKNEWCIVPANVKPKEPDIL